MLVDGLNQKEQHAEIKSPLHLWCLFRNILGTANNADKEQNILSIVTVGDQSYVWQ